MPIWKQALITVILLAVALAGWVGFVPGSRDVLARWGIDWVPFAVASAPASEARSSGGRQGGASQAGVVGAVVTQETINDRLSAIGTGRARQTVQVTPYVAGRLTEIAVESGARVAVGDVIARLDAEAETIAVDRARIALADAEARFSRIQALRSSNTATTVQLNEAELAVQNARLALRDSELSLDRRTVRAPIAGIVGILPVTAGNYVSTSTEIARIDDRSDILVDFWVPERYASLLQVGMELSASSVARPADAFAGVVSALDNRIDGASRTLQVQARITNPEDTLRAGMSFQVSMRFPGDTYPAVDPLAVQWGADGAYVWAVAEGVGKRVPVKIIQRNTNSVLVTGDLRAGEVVVVEGIHVLREGQPVNVARVEGEQGATADTTAQNAPSGT